MKDIAWKQGLLQPKNSKKTLLCCTRSRKSKLASKERLTKCALLKVFIVLRAAGYISFFHNLLQVKHFTLKGALFSQKCAGAVMCLLVSAPDTFCPLNIRGVFLLSCILQGTVYSREDHMMCKLFGARYPHLWPQAPEKSLEYLVACMQVQTLTFGKFYKRFHIRTILHYISS